MSFKKFNLNHYINYIVIGILTVVLSVITMTGGRLDSSLLFLLEKIAISIILAVSLSLVVGFLGELSLGHAGFMCVGAYIGGKVAALLEESRDLPHRPPGGRRCGRCLRYHHRYPRSASAR